MKPLQKSNKNTLKTVACGQQVKVVKMGCDGALKRRLMDMGLTRGARVTVRKVAPLGDPMEISVRGYTLSLRKADADKILVDFAPAPAMGYEWAGKGKKACPSR